MFKNKFLILSILMGSFFIAGCASQGEKDFMKERLSMLKEQSTSKVPEMEVLSGAKYYQSAPTRSPASVVALKGPQNPLPNKHLYFLTLFDQYQALKKFDARSNPEINICPSFHSLLLEHKNKTTIPRTSPFSASYLQNLDLSNEQQVLAQHPELALPIDAEDIRPRVIDVIKNKSEQERKVILSEAIGIHLHKTYVELIELCEYGASNNYYIFENLTTYVHQNQQLGQNADGLKVLFKTSIFTNMALVNSLKTNGVAQASRGIASTMPETAYATLDDKVMERLNVSWVSNYMKAAIQEKK